MARQKGIIKLKGAIGDISFYKSSDGYMAREKGGIDAKRIATDPAFQRTRENNSEFGRAGKAGRMLRKAIRPLLVNVRDRYSTGRLTQLMIKVIQADAVNPRGLRNVIDGEAELLAGFEFNRNSGLESTLYAPYTANIDRVTGAITLAIPAYVPSQLIVAPQGATHYKIVSAGAEIDFEAETYVMEKEESAVLPWDDAVSAALNHSHAVTAASTKPLFLLTGIVFYQQVNAQFYPLKNGAYNPLQVVMVNGI